LEYLNARRAVCLAVAVFFSRRQQVRTPAGELGTAAPVGSGGYLGHGNWVARLLEIFQLSERLKGKGRESVLLGAPKGIAFWR